MDTNKSLSSGALFLRYLVVGILLIVASLAGFRMSELGGEHSLLINAGVLLLINVLVIVLFSKAVLSNETLLVQEDAADHAYYLGFCLTVASLAFSFGVDAILSPLSMDPKSAAEGSSALIKGSLLQFSAGLSATIIGLCAKIYISSEQLKLNAEPEELYRQFRQEIYRFQGEIRGASSELSSAFREIASSLVRSANEAQQSTEELLRLVQENSKSLTRNLSAKRLESATDNFLSATEKMSVSAAQLNEKLNPLSQMVAQFANSVGATSDNLKLAGAASESYATAAGSVSSELGALNKAAQSFSLTWSISEASAKEYAKSYGDLTKAISALETSISAITEKDLSRLSDAAQRSAGALSGIDNSAAATSKVISDLSTEVQKLSNALPALKDSLRETDLQGLIKLLNELKSSLQR